MCIIFILKEFMQEALDFKDLVIKLLAREVTDSAITV